MPCVGHRSGRGADPRRLRVACRDFTFDLARPASASGTASSPSTGPASAGPAAAGRAGVSPLAQADILRAAAAQLGVRRPSCSATATAAPSPWPGPCAHPTDPGGTGDPLGRDDALARGPRTALRRHRQPHRPGDGRPADLRLRPRSWADQTIASIFAPDPSPRATPLRRRRADPAARLAARQCPAGERPEPLRRCHGAGLSRLILPVEILHGTADTIVPGRPCRAPVAPAARAALTVLNEARGHMPHHADPEAIAPPSTARRPAPDCGRSSIISWHL